uniref:Putative secreted protein n=1 Tax=Anopheles marajoara TaxID=58244 RepID=A0A2M4C8Y9_9DIPT
MIRAFRFALLKEAAVPSGLFASTPPCLTQAWYSCCLRSFSFDFALLRACAIRSMLSSSNSGGVGCSSCMYSSTRSGCSECQADRSRPASCSQLSRALR